MNAKVFIFFVNMFLAICLPTLIINVLLNNSLKHDKCTARKGSAGFKQIHLNKTTAEDYPRYRLLYFRRNRTRKRGQRNFIPVLHIPGNEGRPISGAPLANSIYNLGRYYDFYMVDFNMELSGFHGEVLETQSKFAYGCVKYLLELYPQQKSIVVFGHSVGGMIAMGMVESEDFDDSTVAVMILLGSLQQMPVVIYDQLIKTFYADVQKKWRNGRLSEKIIVLSISGGERDVIARTAMTSLSKYDSNGQSIWSTTTSMPHVWGTINHSEFRWCLELHTIIIKALNDVVELNKNKITENRSLIRQVFRQYFTPNYLHLVKNLTNLFSPFNEIHVPWSMNNREMEPCHLVISLEFIRTGLLIISDTSELKWIGACEDIINKRCKQAKDFFPMGFTIPSLSLSPMKFVYLKPEDKWPYKLIVVSALNNSVHLQIETLSKENELLLDLHTLFESTKLVLDGNLHSFYNISLEGFTGVMQAYTVHVDYLSSCSQADFITFKLYVPWGDPPVHYMTNKSQDFEIVLFSNQPHGQLFGSPQLQAFILSGCAVEISIKPAFRRLSYQFIIFYLWYLPSFIAFQVIIQFQAHQFQLISNGHALTYLFICFNLLVIPFVLLWKSFSRLIGLDTLLKNFPEDDIDFLQTMNIWSPKAYLVLHCVAAVIVHLLNWITEVMTSFGASYMNKLILRLVAIALHFIPMAAVILGLWTCGAVALLLMIFLCFLKACLPGKNIKKKHFYQSLFLMSLSHLAPNHITLFLWITNKERFSVTKDPSLLHGMIACCAHFIINSVPHVTVTRRDLLLVCTVFMKLVLLIYVSHATISMYMASYFIDITLILHVCCIAASLFDGYINSIIN